MSDHDLPRSTPAAQAVSSQQLEAFLDSLDAAPDITLHSLMVLRHGQVVAEGWWGPYQPDEIHLLYSLSKSFTSTACGFAVAEGLLSLDDTVVSHFPAHDAVALDPRTRSIRVRDLAAMATGHRLDTLQDAFQLSPDDIVRGMLMIEPEADRGTLFAYNNGATYTLGAIVQQVTGQSLTDYLRPRLFDPLGIEHTYWDRFGGEREIGFSGLHLTTESIAKFGQLYLSDGVWAGEQLLPTGWVAEATRIHTPNPDEPEVDWQQGYGFQFWRSRHGYRGDGAYGQFCVVLPEQDAVLVTTAETENMQGILDAAWTHLLPAFDGPTSDEHDRRLAARLSDLRLAPSDPADEWPVDPLRAGDSWVQAVGVTDQDHPGWTLSVLDHGQRYDVAVGDQAWSRTSVDAGGGLHLEIEASGGWRDTSTFVADLIMVRTPHRLRITYDTTKGTSNAQWHTVPLRTASLLGLATT